MLIVAELTKIKFFIYEGVSYISVAFLRQYFNVEVENTKTRDVI